MLFADRVRFIVFKVPIQNFTYNWKFQLGSNISLNFIINRTKTTKKSSAGRVKSLQKHKEKIFQSNSMISLLKLNSPERHLLKCLAKELKLPHSNNSLPIGKHQMLLIHLKKFKLVEESPKASLVRSFLVV